MIIWGTRSSNVEITQGQFRCPKCETVRTYRHMQQKKYFTLYFIPLIPMGTGGEWWECQVCTRAYQPLATPPAPPAERKAAF